MSDAWRWRCAAHPEETGVGNTAFAALRSADAHRARERDSGVECEITISELLDTETPS